MRRIVSGAAMDASITGGFATGAVNSSPTMWPSAVTLMMISSLRGIGAALVHAVEEAVAIVRRAPRCRPSYCASSRDR